MADTTNEYGGTTGTGGTPGKSTYRGGAPGRTRVEEKLDERVPMPHEGALTSRIEQQTAKAPSITWLVAAGVSIVGSLSLFAMRRPLSAIFVGLWPPTFLLIGNYNTLVKLASENPR